MARAVLIYLTLFRRLDTKEIAFLKRRESQTFWFVLSKIPILAISANWVFLLLGLPWFQNFWLFSCRRIQILAISDFVILFGNYAPTRIPYLWNQIRFFIKLWEELKFGQAKNQTLKIRTWPVGCAVCPLHDGFLNWAGIKVWIAIPPPSRHMFGWSLLVIASQPQHPTLILCWKLGGLGIKFMTCPRLVGYYTI